MTIVDFISDIIQNEFEGTDYFLVNVVSNEAGTKFSFFVDGINGIGIGNCARVSRKVSREIDESPFAEDAFRYEVSSPGAENPLIDKRQYHQHVGRELKIKLKEEGKVEGKLVEIGEDSITLDVVVSEKPTRTKPKQVLFENMEETKVKISFKKVK